MQRGTILDCSWFLFTYRNTPQSTTGTSPVELLMGRRVRSLLNLVKPDFERRVVIEQLKQKQRQDAHGHAIEFDIRDAVFTTNFGKDTTGFMSLLQPGLGPCLTR